MAGIVQSPGEGTNTGRRRQNPSRNPCPGVGFQVQILHTEAENRLKGRRPALALALAFVTLVAIAAAAWPGAAGSAPMRTITLGQTATTPPPSCPGKILNGQPIASCRVEGRITGYQVTAAGISDPFVVPFDGKIVSWSITLARPSRAQTKTTEDEVSFFNDFLGKPSQARIGVLRSVENSKPPKFVLARQSPLQVLNPYFGSKVIFALEHPLTVLRGQVVALTVPTWAPMFAFNLSGENSWRGSRKEKHCVNSNDIKEGHPQQGVGKKKTYGCFYSRARLLYTATVVKQP